MSERHELGSTGFDMSGLEIESLIPVSIEAALCKPGNAKGKQ